MARISYEANSPSYDGMESFVANLNHKAMVDSIIAVKGCRNLFDLDKAAVSAFQLFVFLLVKHAAEAKANIDFADFLDHFLAQFIYRLIGKHRVAH